MLTPEILYLLTLAALLYVGRLALKRPLDQAQDQLEDLEDLVKHLEDRLNQAQAWAQLSQDAHKAAAEALELAKSAGAAVIAAEKRLSAAQSGLSLKLGEALQRKGKA